MNCGGVLEIPSHDAGHVIECYHCGLETWAHFGTHPDPPAPEKNVEPSESLRREPPCGGLSTVRSRRARKPPASLRWVLLGLVGVVIVTYLVGLVWVLAAKRQSHADRLPATPSRPTHQSNLSQPKGVGPQQGAQRPASSTRSSVDHLAGR